MGISVREALLTPWLAGAKVLAGWNGLDNDISSANIMEVPDVINWLKGGELLFTAGFALKDDPRLQRSLVRDLKRRGVAALAIKPGRYLHAVPEDMIEQADAEGLPLIQLPADLAYADVMVPMFEKLLNIQLEQLKRSRDIHNRLLGVVLGGGGMGSISTTLAGLTANPVMIADPQCNLLAVSWPEPRPGETFVGQKAGGEGRELPGSGGSPDQAGLRSLVAAAVRVSAAGDLGTGRTNRFSAVVEGRTWQGVITSIGGNGPVSGYLVIPEVGKAISDQDLMAVEHAATITALEFAKQYAVRETERRLAGEFLEDLIEGNFESDEAILSRAASFKCDLRGILVVFVADIDEFEKYYLRERHRDEAHFQKLKSDVLRATVSAFADYPGGVLAQAKSDTVTGVVQWNGKNAKDRLRELAQGILEKVRLGAPQLSLSIGFGRAYPGPRNVKRSYEEAVTSVRLGRIVFGPGQVTFLDELGVFRFLSEMKDSPSLHQFYDETGSVLANYDARYGTQLVRTLQEYFRSGCNLRKTAGALYIHKNSVIYRLKKIEELTGLSFNDPEERLNLQMGLKLIHLFGMKH